MRYPDIEVPKIRAPKSVKIDTDKIAKSICNFEDDSFDFIDTEE